MAIVTERITTHRDGDLTFDVTYDDTDGTLEGYRVECHAARPVFVQVWRNDRAQPWREATLNDGDVYEQTKPLGGGFRTLDQLAGIGYTAEYV